MALVKIAVLFLACLVQLCASQSVEVEVTVSSPSDVVDGESTDVVFSADLTAYDGAASVINALADQDKFSVMYGIFTSDAGDVSTALGGDNINLTTVTLPGSLTDGVAVTFSSLTATLDLTSEECGNDGSAYTYFCVIISPTSAGWSGVDTSNNTDCAPLICKAVVNLAADTLTLTNPDNAELGVGGGQAIEFDVVVSSPAGSDSVNGVSNWAATAYLSDAESGGSVVASTSVSLTSAQLTVDVTNGSSATLEDLAVTLDLTDVSCDDFAYSCVTMEPHSSASWKLASGASNTVCAAVTCGASAARVGLLLLAVCTVLSSLLNRS